MYWAWKCILRFSPNFNLKVTGSSWTTTKVFSIVLSQEILCYESYNQLSFFYKKTPCNQQCATLHCPVWSFPDERGSKPMPDSQTINTLSGMGDILEESSTLCSYLNLFQVSFSSPYYWSTLKCSPKSKAKNTPYISQIGAITVLVYRSKHFDLDVTWVTCHTKDRSRHRNFHQYPIWCKRKTIFFLILKNIKAIFIHELTYA